MTNNTIALKFDTYDNHNLIPSHAEKDESHRLTRFVDWLNETGRTWMTPDLSDLGLSLES